MSRYLKDRIMLTVIPEKKNFWNGEIELVLNNTSPQSEVVWAGKPGSIKRGMPEVNTQFKMAYLRTFILLFRRKEVTYIDFI